MICLYSLLFVFSDILGLSPPMPTKQHKPLTSPKIKWTAAEKDALKRQLGQFLSTLTAQGKKTAREPFYERQSWHEENGGMCNALYII